MRTIDADALIEFCAERWIPLNIDAVNMQPTIQPEKTQLSQEGTTSDMISRQAALDIFDDYNVSVENGELEAYSRDRKRLCDLPPIQLVATDTNVGDTISRRAALDALDFEIVHMTAYCDGKNEGNPLAQYNKGLEDGKKAIEALPSAQPEPHEGHWIEGKIYRDVIECNCSECGQLMTTAATVRMNYCPNCGAKMTISTK